MNRRRWGRVYVSRAAYTHKQQANVSVPSATGKLGFVDVVSCFVRKLGEVKAFICLLQDDDPAQAGTPRQPPIADVTTTQSTTLAPSSPGSEVFLTLPALEAFVEGGDAYLSRKECAAVARGQSRDAASSDLHGLKEAQAASKRSKQDATGAEASNRRPRADSWAAVENDPGGDAGEGSKGHGRAPEEEGPLLERLKAVLARAPGATTRNNEEGVGANMSMSGEGVRGHLDSFDVDGDGVLQTQDLIAALRSLGAKGEEFRGRRGVEAIMHRFRDNTDRPASSSAGSQIGVTIVKLAWWFEEQAGTDDGGADAADDRRTCGRITTKEDGSKTVENGGTTAGGFAAGEALRKAVRLAEAKGRTLERTFARLDDDGDGFITLRQLLRGLDQLGVFEKVPHYLSKLVLVVGRRVVDRAQARCWSLRPVSRKYTVEVASTNTARWVFFTEMLILLDNVRKDDELHLKGPVPCDHPPVPYGFDELFRGHGGLVEPVSGTLIHLCRLFPGLSQASRDDVLDVLDELDAERQPNRPAKEGREEEAKDGGRDSGGSGVASGVDLVAFIRLMRQRPRHTPGLCQARGDQTTKPPSRSFSPLRRQSRTSQWHGWGAFARSGNTINFVVGKVARLLRRHPPLGKPQGRRKCIGPPYEFMTD